MTIVRLKLICCFNMLLLLVFFSYILFIAYEVDFPLKRTYNLIDLFTQ